MLALGRLAARELGVPSREPAASLAPVSPPAFDTRTTREEATLEESPTPRHRAAPTSPYRANGTDDVAPALVSTRTLAAPEPAIPRPRVPRAIEAHDEGSRDRPGPPPRVERDPPRRAPAPSPPLQPSAERAPERVASLAPVVAPIDRPAPPRVVADVPASETSARAHDATTRPPAERRPDRDAQALRPVLSPTPPLASGRREATGPPVQITIGRLEIRASRDVPAAAPPRPPADHEAPSLASYLRRRSNGERS